MMNVDNYERQNLLLRIMNQHKELIVLAEEKRDKYSKDALQQFQILDNITKEMMKANAYQLGLYQYPDK